MKFRYPSLSMIKNTALVFLCVYVVTLLMLKFFHMQNDIIIFYLLAGMCLAFCVVEFIFLNFFWYSVVFDSTKKSVLIDKKIFFFTRKKAEIPFNQLQTALKHKCMSSGGYVWQLTIENAKTTKNELNRLNELEDELGPEFTQYFESSERFILAQGLIKSRLSKKKKEIEDRLKTYS